MWEIEGVVFSAAPHRALCTIDLSVTQAWAERIAAHPAGFHGIAYQSRHTNCRCLVLWNRVDRDLSGEITFVFDGEFIHSKPAYDTAAAKGLKLTFV